MEHTIKKQTFMNPIRIDILYFEGCPNHSPAVKLVQQIVDEFSLDAEINEIEIHGSDDAVSHRFLGSPTIQVDGVDIELDARKRTDYGFSCRTYSGSGLPARSMLVSALTEFSDAEADANPDAAVDNCGELQAAIPESKNCGLLASTGSILVAMAASACCWLPLVLIAVGISAGGLGAAFDSARPYMIVASILLLSVGFYFAYRKPKCEPGSECATSQNRMQRLNRRMLWTATIAVALFASLPLYIGFLLPDQTIASVETIGAARTTVGLSVDGMTCEACAFTLRDELAGLTGVVDARVSFKTGQLELVLASNSMVSNESILETVRSAGFQGRLLKNDQENQDE